jgi:ribonuclease D
VRWSRRKPEAAVRLDLVRAGLTELSQRVSVPAENLVTPELVRRLIWDWQPVPDASAVIDAFLTEAGARRWQRELTVPVLTEALTAPQPQQPEQAAE